MISRYSCYKNESTKTVPEKYRTHTIVELETGNNPLVLSYMYTQSSLRLCIIYFVMIMVYIYITIYNVYICIHMYTYCIYVCSKDGDVYSQMVTQSNLHNV